MRQLGLKVKVSRRYKLTTDSRHSFPVAQNLVNRDFEVASPNTTWATDISVLQQRRRQFVGSWPEAREAA